MDEDLKIRYLRDPCGTLATAFWKEKAFAKPKGMAVIHEKCMGHNHSVKGTRYFRMIHRMEECCVAFLPNGYIFRNVNMPDEAGLVADFINRCYEGYSQTKDSVSRWMGYPVFVAELWVFIWDEEKNIPAALGIADFDEEIGEGSLEWIQVLPEYRSKGLGKAVALELIARLHGLAAFVTVSGEVDSASNPEALYRKCGFTGDDVWFAYLEMRK